MVFIKDILVTYWSQSLIILGGCGYLIKRSLDLAGKKVEVRYSLFHEQKLSAINEFLVAYSALENFFWQVAYHDIIDRKITPKQLDEMILPLYNNFNRCYYSLFLVINDGDLKEFNDIKEKVINVRTELGKLFYIDVDVKKGQIASQYYRCYQDMMKKNELTLKSIGIKFRNSYDL